MTLRFPTALFSLVGLVLTLTALPAGAAAGIGDQATLVAQADKPGGPGQPAAGDQQTTQKKTETPAAEAAEEEPDCE